jgi:hypothetical protein
VFLAGADNVDGNGLAAIFPGVRAEEGSTAESLAGGFGVSDRWASSGEFDPPLDLNPAE